MFQSILVSKNFSYSFKDQYLIVRASKDIPANSEILNCYGKN